MKKVILTKGLPGSGKTTWAKGYQTKYPETILVNKDELRAMLHNSIHSNAREAFVLKVRDFIIKEAVAEGHDVIVHDTNLHSKHKNHIWKIVGEGAIVEMRDFTDVSLEECIRRDQKRANYVGEKVIRDMYNKHLAPQPEVISWIPLAPTAIMCDVDGTLALFPGQNPYDRDFSKDILNNHVREILWNFQKAKDKIILVSGRTDKFIDVTMKWLSGHGVPYDHLFMRKADDIRKDVIIKKEIYDSYIKDKFNVRFVLDDRNQVVDMWRSLGLTCLQVAPGDF